jgi:hypothetical protein
MNTKRGVTWGLLAAAAAGIAMAAMAGCELLVDFDRSKIPTGDASASLSDDSGPMQEASTSSMDGPSEGSNSDVQVSMTDAAKDAETEGGDASVIDGEAGQPMPEASPSDTGTDATNEVDTGADTGPDVVVSDAGADGS